MTDQARRLAEDNHNLIYGMLTKHQLPVDEFYGAAAVGLCKAAKTFDPGRGIKFSTYAYWVMLNEARMEMRRHKRQAREISLDAEISEDSMTLSMQLADPYRLEEAVESEDAAARMLDRLQRITSPRDREIIRLAASGMKQVEIARRIGIAQSVVSRRIKALKVRVILS